MDMWTFFLLCATAVLGLFCCKANGDASEEDFINLTDTLLRDYKRHVRPVANQSAAVSVTFKFGLIAVEEIDDIKQHVNVLTVIFLEWTDKNLVWNSSQYGDIDRLYLDENKIWAPQVYVRHSPNNEAFLSSLPTRHVVFSNGNVVFESAGAIYTACGLEMTYFPFDTHACTISFGVLDSSTKDVVLEAGDVFFTPDNIENEEWSVNSIDIERAIAGRPDFSTVEITIEFTRRPVYYIVNVILPTVVLGILSLLAFIVPAESGERLSYTLTTLLSLSVYIPYIGGLIPTSSVHMPVVLRYLISLFLMNAMCVVMSTVIIAIRWSDVVDKNDVQKTILIFGIPVTIKKRRGDKPFAPGQNFECKDASLSKDTGISFVPWRCCACKETRLSNPPGNEYPKAKIENVQNVDKQPSRDAGPVVERNEQGSKHTQATSGDNHALTTFAGRKQVDPDVMAISDLVSWHSFLALILSFFVMTAVTFVQLYCQSF